MTRGHGRERTRPRAYLRDMEPAELRSLLKPVTALDADELAPELLERAAAYNTAVSQFGDAIRAALAALHRGEALDLDEAANLRVLAADLVIARAWLVDRARLPASARLE